MVCIRPQLKGHILTICQHLLRIRHRVLMRRYGRLCEVIKKEE
jgi:hypothetical protein